MLLNTKNTRERRKKYMYALTITNKCGFCCYSVIDADQIIDLGDCYNVVAKGIELFIDKNSCNGGRDWDGVVPLHYTTSTLQVYLETL